MNRRHFLRSASAAAVTAAIARPSIAAPSAPKRVGIQLYTARSLMEQDPVMTITQIAGLGYDSVEFAGYYGMSRSDTRALLGDLGLSAPSTHADLATLRQNVDGMIETCLSVGHEFLVCAYVAPPQRQTADDWRGIMHELNHFGEKCREAGIRFAYHNHEFEFEQIEGVLPHDLMMERTDPSLVKYELDLFWATFAGLDPAALMRQHPDRFKLFHVKDMAADRRMADVGDGTIDFPALFDVAAEVGGLYWYVERDDTRDPMSTARRSLEAIRGM